MSADHDRLLEFVAEIHGHLDLAEFRTTLLDALARLVPSDWASLNDVGRTPGEVIYASVPEAPPEVHEPFARLGDENPLVQRFIRTQDGRPYRFSDVVTPAQLHALALYREVYARIGAEHQIAFVVRTSRDAFLGLALSRRNPDYTDAERALLDRIRPSIIQAYTNAADVTQALRAPASRTGTKARIAAALTGAGLTPREADVVSLLAVGHSVATQADELGISVRTVNKHLQNGYRKLGVTTKTTAVDAAWDLAAAAEPAARPTGRPDRIELASA